jgi:hypothetical protein
VAVKRKVFIQSREFIPEVAEITGMSPILIDYEFGKAEILGVVCVFEVELTAEQAQEIDRRAKVLREARAKGVRP